MVPVQEIVRYVLYLSPTFFDKNIWDTSTERCFFPSRPSPLSAKVVYRSKYSKSFTPTLGGQEFSIKSVPLPQQF